MQIVEEHNTLFDCYTVFTHHPEELAPHVRVILNKSMPGLGEGSKNIHFGGWTAGPELARAYAESILAACDIADRTPGATANLLHPEQGKKEPAHA